MKKFYYLVASMAFVLVVIMACEKSAIGVDEIQTLSKEEVLLSKVLPKIDVCHWDEYEGWKIISISENAWDAHMKHSDGEYSDTKLTDFDGDGFYAEESACSVADCDDNDFSSNAYSFAGDFTFHYKSGGVNYPHLFEFGTVNGTDFDVIGYWPTRENPTYAYDMEVNFNEDGTFEIHTIEPGHDTWTIHGTWDKCDGIISLESPWSTTEWTF